MCNVHSAIARRDLVQYIGQEVYVLNDNGVCQLAGKLTYVDWLTLEDNPILHITTWRSEEEHVLADTEHVTLSDKHVFDKDLAKVYGDADFWTDTRIAAAIGK